MKNPPFRRVIKKVSRAARDRWAFFITLLKEVHHPEKKRSIRKRFVQLIYERNPSRNVMVALGYAADEEPEALEQEDRTLVLKLVEVTEMRGLGQAGPR